MKWVKPKERRDEEGRGALKWLMTKIREHNEGVNKQIKKQKVGFVGS